MNVQNFMKGLQKRSLEISLFLTLKYFGYVDESEQGPPPQILYYYKDVKAKHSSESVAAFVNGFKISKGVCWVIKLWLTSAEGTVNPIFKPMIFFDSNPRFFHKKRVLQKTLP